MYKQDLALNNLEWLICLQTKPNQTKFVQANNLQITYNLTRTFDNVLVRL